MFARLNHQLDVKITRRNLDVLVNEDETLRDFITNTAEFYGMEIPDSEIESWSEEELIQGVGHLDDLWSK